MYSYKYPRAALTVDAIVITSKSDLPEILLIQRGNEPFKNMWALPGGFIDMDETLEKACKRELLEETGLKTGRLIQFKTYDAINRDPRHRTITVVYYTFIEKTEEVKGDDDAVKAGWFPLTGLPPLAFDHSEIIGDFVTEILK
ncbi:MAG: NUDIX hydrolase [Prolixibacteraceae bacterium]|nr:NUDIX hydrolase [Prolixibacteraceae bacterium]MBN2772663.1 NUDIX hydrolase [Prolixibacteraceae bacterium]